LELESIDVDAAINNVKRLLEKERDLSPTLKSEYEVILPLVTILSNRTTLKTFVTIAGASLYNIQFVAIKGCQEKTLQFASN